MRTSISCLLLLGGFLIVSGCAHQDVPAPTYSVKGRVLNQKMPVTASAASLFNACSQSCTDNPNYSRQDLQTCLDTCYALHREFPIEHRQYSTWEKCTADTEKILNSYDVITARYYDWCEEQSSHPYKRRACKDAVAAFHSALSPSAVCLRTTEAMHDTIVVHPANQEPKPRLTIPPSEFLTMSPITEPTAKKTPDKKQSKTTKPQPIQNSTKTTSEKTANTANTPPPTNLPAKSNETGLQSEKDKDKKAVSTSAPQARNTGSSGKQPAIIDTKPADSPKPIIPTQESKSANPPLQPTEIPVANPSSEATSTKTSDTTAVNSPAPQSDVSQQPSPMPSANATASSTKTQPTPTIQGTTEQHPITGEALQPAAMPSMPKNSTTATEFSNQPLEQTNMPARLTQEEQEKIVSEKQLPPDKSGLPMILPPIEDVKE